MSAPPASQVLPQLVEHLLERRVTYGTATRSAVRRCVADALACAAAGTQSPTYAKVVNAVDPLFGGPDQASVWFGDRRASLLGAAYLNSTAVAADDLDDGHRGAVGHPGGAIIPAVLAYAETVDVEQDLCDAIAFGYDVSIAVAVGRVPHRVPTMATGRWAAYGVAAAAWALSGEPADVLTHALGHAGSLSPQLVHPSAATPDGLKEGTAWATAAGLSALHLAVAGVDAPTHVLDHHPDYDDGWFQPRSGRPAVEDAYFKRYACCRWIHPALDLIYDLKAAGDLPDHDGIEVIDIETFARSLTLPNDPAPTTLESAHYSFPFCVGLAVCSSPETFLPLTLASVSDPRARAVAKMVRLHERPHLTNHFPATTPVRLTITANGTSTTAALPTAIGDPTVPLPDEFLPSKHHHLLRAHPDVSHELDTVRTTDRQLTLNQLATSLNLKPLEDHRDR